MSKSKPRLIVVISVDQMGYQYLERFKGHLEGGFKTLSDEGCSFTRCMYRHSVTATGPGHATIGSGRHPSSTGIVGNEWYDRGLGRVVGVVKAGEFDDNVPQAERRSPGHLLVPGIGDSLKADEKHRDSKVVGVSLKDRAAILMAGQNPDAAYWFDKKAERWVTSPYYKNAQLAEIAAGKGGKGGRKPLPKLVEQALSGVWPLSKDKAAYKPPICRKEDDYYTEAVGGPKWFPLKSFSQVNEVWVHEMNKFSDRLIRSPLGDELTLEVATRAVAAHSLGQADPVDMLFVSFSALDMVGHIWGPLSWECADTFLRLDDLLAQFIASLNEAVGDEGLLIALTADHGSVPLPEYSTYELGRDGNRIKSAVFYRNVAASMDASRPRSSDLITRGVNVGLGDPEVDLGLYVDRERAQAAGLSVRAAEDLIAAACARQPHVEAVYTASELNGLAADKDEFVRLFRNSHHLRDRSPDVYVRFKEWTYFGNFPGGTGHGSPWHYDRHVPLFFWGYGVPDKVRGARVDTECGPEDIAPTLAKMLKIKHESEPGTGALSELFD